MYLIVSVSELFAACFTFYDRFKTDRKIIAFPPYPKKTNVSFLETSQNIFGSVGRPKYFFGNFFIKDKHENNSKHPKNRRKNLRCPKKNEKGPKNVGLVGFPETRHFFFWP